MRSIVINVPKDKHRLKEFKAVYPKDLLPKLEVWKAKTGKDVEVPSWWNKSPNQYALTINFADILDSVDEDVFIWEDDCTFSEDFNTRFPEFMKEVPDRADMVFLGGFYFHNPQQISTHVLSLNGAWCGHAILYKRSCLKKLADYFREPGWTCAHFSDQRRSKAIQDGLLTAYGALDTLCGQSSGISSLEGNDREARWYTQFNYKDLSGNIVAHK